MIRHSDMEMMVMREEAYGTHSSVSRRSIGRSTRVGQEAEGAREDEESLDHGFHGRGREGRVGRLRAGWSEPFHCLAHGPGMNRAGVYRLSM